MSKIAYININGFNPVLCDGVSTSTFELLLYLKSFGHEVFVNTLYTNEKYSEWVFRFLSDDASQDRSKPEVTEYSEEFRGIRVYQALLPFGHKEVMSHSRQILNALMAILEDQRPDFVLTSEDDLLPLFAVSVAGIPGAHVFHSVSYVQAYGRAPLYVKLLKKRIVFVASRFLGRYISRTIGIEPIVWYPLFDLNQYRVPRNPHSYDLGYYSAGPHKGDAVVNRLLTERSDWKFLVVGRNYTHNFSSLPLNLSYRGDLTDYSQFYSAIRVLLVPSLIEEVFPRVILEASVNGIPVVANEIGGIPEALGNSGVLVNYSNENNKLDIDDLCGRYLHRIERILSDGLEYEKLSSRALARADEYTKAQEELSFQNYAKFIKAFVP